MKIDLIKDGQYPTDDIVLEESDIWEVETKIRIPYNGRQLVFSLTTFIRIQPPLGVDEEPTLTILDSVITHLPKRYIEETILDIFRGNIKKKNDYE